jgi:hypothetical protein
MAAATLRATVAITAVVVKGPKLNWINFDPAGNDSRKTVCDLYLHYKCIVCTDIFEHRSGASRRAGDGRTAHSGGGYQRLLTLSLSNIHLYQIPWWLLVSFGSYSLWSLGWGLFTFRDCSEAYEELMTVSRDLYCSERFVAGANEALLQEISMAKADLRAKGVAVD